MPISGYTFSIVRLRLQYWLLSVSCNKNIEFKLQFTSKEQWNHICKTTYSDLLVKLFSTKLNWKAMKFVIFFTLASLTVAAKSRYLCVSLFVILTSSRFKKRPINWLESIVSNLACRRVLWVLSTFLIKEHKKYFTRIYTSFLRIWDWLKKRAKKVPKAEERRRTLFWMLHYIVEMLCF